MIKYSENGLWIKQEENRYTVGISPKGQDDIGDVSFVELFPRIINNRRFIYEC